MKYNNEIENLIPEYVKLGAKEAKNLRPSSNATTPDINEVSLRTKALTYHNEASSEIGEELVKLTTSAGDIENKLNQYPNKAQGIIDDGNLEQQIDIELASIQNDVVSCVKKKISKEIPYNYFRTINGISSDAEYPESMLWHFAIITVCFLGETLANSYFLKDQGDDGNWLNGFVFATLISLINVSTAAFLGYGWRYKNLKEKTPKILGESAFIIFIILTIFLNSLFASYRSFLQSPTVTAFSDQDLIVSIDPNAFTKAIIGALTLQWHITDIMSFMLFVFGLILSGLAFWKGYTLDDKYPAYGDLDRSLKKFQAAEDEHFKTIRKKIQSMLDQYVQKIMSAMREPDDLRSSVNSAVNNYRNRYVLVSARFNKLEDHYNLALRSYRNANKAVRGANLPCPAYFNVFDNLSDLNIASRAEIVILRMTTLIAEIEIAKNNMHLPLNNKLLEARAISARILVDKLEVYSADITETARRQVQTALPAGNQ